MIRRIFLDETGYTGDNLLDLSQPVLCVASIAIDENTARQLLQNRLGPAQAIEYKFKNVRKSGRLQGAVLDMLEDLLSLNIEHETYLAYKPFAALLKAIDWLAEPSLKIHGINIYENGAMLSYGNTMWHTLSAGGDSTCAKFLEFFQDAVCVPSRSNFESFFKFSDHIYREHELGGELLTPILETLAREGPSCCSEIPKPPLDLSMTVANTLLHRWRHRVGPTTGLHLIHDESRHMAKQKDVLDFLLSPTRPPFEQTGDKRGAIFPLTATYEFANSTILPGLQVADLFAGSMAEAFRVSLGLSTCFSREDEIKKLMSLFEHLSKDSVVVMAPTLAIGPDATGQSGVDHDETLDYLIQQWAEFDKI